jgi:hypothetical protein
MPMIHPQTGETITSYKKLMHDPTTRDTWRTPFGKDFGGMAQVGNKTGQQGTDSIFVMTHDDIRHIPTDCTITYARVVVNFRPQKTDPHRVRITAGGNLINYPGELTTKTADLITSKLMWNSVLSTKGAKYMCLDIKNFYLTAPLDRYEYMKMLISLFPSWTREKYNLDTHAKKGVCLPGNAPCHLGTPIGRNPCQQIAQKETPPPWVLRMHTYPGSLEAPHPTHFFHISGRQFWGQIHRKRTRSTFNYVFERRIRAYQRLDGQFILRNKPHLGLRSTHP